MKAPYPWSNFGFFFIINTFFICNFSSATYVLNLSLYQPSGACIGENEKINIWSGIPSTLCCENALIAYCQALADHAVTTSGDLFINSDSWNACASITSPARQESFSTSPCGFQDFHPGSCSCSNLSLSTIQADPSYNETVNKCSQLSSDFDSACKDCTHAILNLRENMQTTNAKIDTEKALCTFAVVTSAAAARLNDNSTFLDDFYSCMSALDQFDPGYIVLKTTVAKALASTVVAFFVLMLILILIKYVARNKEKGDKKLLTKPILLHKEKIAWSGIYRFSKAEIENAINFYGERKSLGRGSPGQVYKGVLPSGQVVAIKHINKSNSSDSFTREVKGLSRIRHPNLVSLLGCCSEGGEQFLVHEYCSAGNLAQHLLRKATALTWEKRVKILRDCALAQKYLHHFVDGCVVHRDIKLTNILLTENLDPKLSDFGLAKMLWMEESKVFMEVIGTIGYMDTEYMTNTKLTSDSNINSFGIVALQILSGQKVIELDFDARDQLTRKAKDVYIRKRPLTDFVDSRMEGNVNNADFNSILQVAVLCVAKSSKGRPPIEEVFDVMEKAWKNTMVEMKAKKETSSSATSMSMSLEVTPV